MKESAVLKTSSDICFVLGLFCLFAPLGPFLWPLLALSAACLADGLLLCRIKNTALRIALSLLPAPCLLMAHSAIQYIAMGAALVYFFVFIWTGMPSMKIWTYRGFFTAFVCVGTVLLAVALIAGFAVIGSVVFFFLFLILGALALRLMRMGASMSLKWNVSNMGSFVVPVLFSIAAAVVVYFVLLGIVWLLGQVIVPYAGKAERPSYTSGVISKTPVPLNQSTFQSVDDYDRIDQDEGEPAKRNIADLMRQYPYIKYIVLGVAAVIVFIIVYRRMNSDRDLKEDEFFEESGREAGSASGGRRKRGKKQKDSTNAQKIRKIYREYLFYLTGKGASFSSNSTSSDVLDSSRAVSGSGSNDRLRDIYIKARYGEGADITDEDVTFARKMLEEIREYRPEQQ
jgi:hypothetical protein